jgi:hypothetical protein
MGVDEGKCGILELESNSNGAFCPEIVYLYVWAANWPDQMLWVRSNEYCYVAADHKMLGHVCIIIEGVMLVESIFYTFLPSFSSNFISVTFPVRNSGYHLLNAYHYNVMYMLYITKKVFHVEIFWSFDPWDIPSNNFDLDLRLLEVYLCILAKQFVYHPIEPYRITLQLWMLSSYQEHALVLCLIVH